MLGILCLFYNIITLAIEEFIIPMGMVSQTFPMTCARQCINLILLFLLVEKFFKFLFEFLFIFYYFLNLESKVYEQMC